MSFPNKVYNYFKTVTVTGGAGSGTFFPGASDAGWEGKSILIAAPNGASYALVLTDGDGFVVYATPTLTGDVALLAEFCAAGGLTVAIAGTDGPYRVKLYRKA